MNNFLFLGFLVLLGFVGAESHRYRAHDRIGLVANTVGPFNNPTETYPVRNIPFTSLLI